MPEIKLIREHFELISEALNERLEKEKRSFFKILCKNLNAPLDTPIDKLRDYQQEALYQTEKQIQVTQARIKLFELENENDLSTEENSSKLSAMKNELLAYKRTHSELIRHVEHIEEIESLARLISNKATEGEKDNNNPVKNFFPKSIFEDLASMLMPHNH